MKFEVPTPEETRLMMDEADRQELAELRKLRDHHHRTADPTLCPECGGRGCVGHETEGPCWMCGGWNDEKRKRLKEQEEGIRCCGGCPDCLGIGAGEQIASLTRDNARLRAFLRHTLQRIDEALAR